MLWRGADRSPRLVGAARGALFPDDRNAIAAYADATLVLLAPLSDRPGDRLTLGAARSRIGGAARGRDADAARLGGTGEPGRSREILVELGYGARFDVAGRAVLVQPFLQWIGRPAAGAGQDALDGRPARDAVVTGIRLAATLF